MTHWWRRAAELFFFSVLFSVLFSLTFWDVFTLDISSGQIDDHKHLLLNMGAKKHRTWYLYCSVAKS